MNSRLLAGMTAEDVEISHQACVLIKRKFDISIAQRASIVAEIKRLQSELSTVDEDRVDLGRDFDVAANALSKTWCRAFAHKFLKAVTVRELKDMVYEHLIGDASDVHIIASHDRGYHPGVFQDVSGSYGPYQPWEAMTTNNSGLIPFYFMRKFMGNQFEDEICQSFYRTMRMIVHHYDDLFLLLEYGPLQKQPSSRPAEFVRRLEICLSFDSYWSGKGFGEAERLEKTATKQKFEGQIEKLAKITEIKHLAGFELKIIVDAWSRPTAEKYAEILVPFVYDIQAKGVNVVVEGRAGGATVDFIYDKPRSEWEEKIRNESAFACAE